MNIEEKKFAILEGALTSIRADYPARIGIAAGQLARACALLTSQVKAEREEGKAMVRRWKHGNTF